MGEQVFSAARQVDQAFVITLGIAVGILVLVTVLMVVFVWRYHHTRSPRATEIPGNVWLELLWTVIPSVLVMAMFWYGWTSFRAMRSVPADAMTVRVESRMWSWSFIYPEGRRSNVLVAPVDRAVRLDMQSLDVIHSFYVPAMRIKMDTVPGMTTTVWFKSDREGEFDILCAEYCGLKHANMITTLKVVSQDEFEAWLAGDKKSEDAGPGLDLLDGYGCTSCHSMDGSQGVGPTFKGLAGARRTVALPDGRTITLHVDETYLRRAILAPEAEVVEGFDPDMPPYEGAIPDDELGAMVRFLMTGSVQGPPPGRALAEEEGCLSCHSTDGSIIAGPSFRGLYGSGRQVLDAQGKGKTVEADEAYLRESILAPEALMVKDFDPMMPPYDYLEPEQVDSLLEYIKSLAGEQG